MPSLALVARICGVDEHLCLGSLFVVRLPTKHWCVILCPLVTDRRDDVHCDDAQAHFSNQLVCFPVAARLGLSSRCSSRFCLSLRTVLGSLFVAILPTCRVHVLGVSAHDALASSSVCVLSRSDQFGLPVSDRSSRSKCLPFMSQILRCIPCGSCSGRSCCSGGRLRRS